MVRPPRRCSRLFGAAENGSLVLRGFAGGVVVMVGDKPTFAARFPKVATPTMVQSEVEFVKRHITAIGESYAKHLRSVKARMEREEELRGISAMQAEVNRRLAAIS